ncbi:unnamed protein product [Thelazia callipaeda]|uniref:Pept_C1 domain-containing protein n=1 Tax=Thelazia callipaeda TaxID=103827 RepID=A0A0N5CPQ0_THECL|nr:unnamed protein product [Thelazia callipaeda]
MKFAKNLRIIDEHNKRFEQGLETFKMGLNEMSDWTEEELRGLTGFKQSRDMVPMGNLSHILKNKMRLKLPPSIDYRTKGILAPIKHQRFQGECNICYIFTAVSALEAYTALRKKKTVRALSEQNVMDCSEMEKCMGNGGSSAKVFQWVANTYGLMAESDYPYKEKDNPSCLYDPKKAIAKPDGGAILPYNDEIALKKVLAFIGPVCASIHASDLSFVNYKSGKCGSIYQNRNCSSSLLAMDHEVLIVGYGEERGQQYYIIRNSWGRTWGENGYGRILANAFTCGIGRESSIPLM